MWRFPRKSTSELRPALFMHVQKTAGTSIVELAIKRYGSAAVCSHGDFVNRLPADFEGLPFVSGHFGYDFARTLMAERYSFTFLREPTERLLSFYYFCKNRDASEFEIYKLAQENNLEKFVQLVFEKPSVKATIWNHQAWQLAHGFGRQDNRNINCFKPEEIFRLAIDHLREFDHIGFTETFEEDKKHILRELGIADRLFGRRANVTRGKPAKKELPSSTKKLLDQITELDKEVYQFAWSHRKNHF